ncbi:MAG: glycosyltransferase [Bacteroidota bacterium]|nr:glycosyltransferase [Bacteroidota bacterium]
MDKIIKDSPSVSVLMPVYNGEQFLREAIDSILGQTWKNFEFIIINDGSTDGSEEIILSYKDNRIVYLKNEINLGLIATLNKGLSIAKGKYIARMDADDVSLPERFAEQFKYMEIHTEVGVSSTYYHYIENGSIKKSNFWYGSEEVNTLLLFNSCLCHPAVFIRRSLLEENNIRYESDFRHAEDYRLWAVLSRVARFGIIDKTLFYYRLHPSQVTTVHNEEQKANGNRVRKDFLNTMGFDADENERYFHNLVGMNSRINNLSDLKGIESWFIKMAKINERKKIFGTESFNKVIGKLWLDTCGNTTLGMKSRSIYMSSELRQLSAYVTTFMDNLKLIIKCLVR